jgi:hypothetical protein
MKAYVLRPTANGPVGVGRPPGVLQPQESELSLAAIKVHLHFQPRNVSYSNF